jgi:hypothetical protein
VRLQRILLTNISIICADKDKWKTGLFLETMFIWIWVLFCLLFKTIQKPTVTFEMFDKLSQICYFQSCLLPTGTNQQTEFLLPLNGGNYFLKQASQKPVPLQWSHQSKLWISDYKQNYLQIWLFICSNYFDDTKLGCLWFRIKRKHDSIIIQ